MPRHRWSLLLAIVPLTLGAISVGLSFRPTTAHACSCMAPPPAVHQLGGATAAFVGTPVAMSSVEPTEDRWESVVYRFNVQQLVKGDLPATIDVYTAGDGAACGVTFELNQPIGLLPYGTTVDGEPHWSAGMCGGVMAPEELLAAADEQLPAPTSVAPIASLVSGRYGPAGIVALDADAQPVGWVLADDSLSSVLLAACPGGETALALSGYDNSTVVAIDLRTLTVTSRRELPPKPTENDIDWYSASRLTCTSPDGADATVFVSALEYGPPSVSRVAVLTGDDIQVHTLGRTADLLTISATAAVAVADDTVLSVDLATGATEVLAVLPDQLVLSVVADGDEGLVLLTASERDDFVYIVDALVLLPRDGETVRSTTQAVDPTRAYSGRLTATSEGWLVAGLENGVGLLGRDGSIDTFTASPFVVSGGVLTSDFEAAASIRTFDGTIIDIGVPVAQARAATIVVDGVVPTAGLPSTSAMRGATANSLEAAAAAGPDTTDSPDGSDTTAGDQQGTVSGDGTSLWLWLAIGLAAAAALVAAAVVVRRRSARGESDEPADG